MIVRIQDNFRTDFGETIDKRHEMRRNNIGDHRGINNPQIAGAIYLHSLIDNTSLILREHSGGARRVIFSSYTPLDKLVPLLVRLNAVAWNSLVTEEGFEWGRLANVACKLEARTKHESVRVLLKVARVDNGMLERIRRVDHNRTATEAMLHSRLHHYLTKG